MNCPYCGLYFKNILANAKAEELPDEVPGVCGGCQGIFLMVRGMGVRRLTEEELAAVQQSPAFQDVIAPAIDIIRRGRGDQVQ